MTKTHACIVLLLAAGCGDDGKTRDAAGNDTTSDATDATVADTAVADTTVADTTVADTAVADTAVSDTSPADIPTPTGLYEPAAEYEVGMKDWVVENDDRDLPVRIRYPIGAPEPLPVLVFSHGGGFNNVGHRSYSEWGTVLAKAGYVAINVAHVEDPVPNRHCALLGIPPSECEPGDAATEPAEGGTLSVIWYDKPRDLSRVFDALDGIADQIGLELDLAKVGAAGHSGGAYSVINCAGAVPEVSPSVREMHSEDPRFVAFLAMSPQGVGRLGMTETSWDDITAPVMIQTGASDNSEGEQAAGRRDAFAHMHGPEKYEAYYDTALATHIAFGLNADADARVLEGVARTGLAFLDAYVRGRPEAMAWLQSSALEDVSQGIATLSRK